ncbi:MAG: hypothetical protein WBN37_07075, partial [Arenicellales bacterium]
KDLLLEKLIPEARAGLSELGLSEKEVSFYLDVFEARVQSGQNGAAWQRSYLRNHDCSVREMTETYIKNQQSSKPVHEWLI